MFLEVLEHVITCFGQDLPDQGQMIEIY
eukprot:COSAG06_NODE_53292_length_301_cov_0.405941_2_plen_27_part_01